MDKTPLIAPEQCRAARAMLAWKRSDLAAKSDVSARALASFEVGTAKLMRGNQRSVVTAFEAAGVEFIEGGVRWKDATPKPAAPAVDAEVEIRTEAQRLVAELKKRKERGA